MWEFRIRRYLHYKRYLFRVKLHSQSRSGVERTVDVRHTVVHIHAQVLSRVTDDAEAIRNRVDQLKRERLAGEMAEGYRAEAQRPSLDAEWAGVETEGL